jgi:hypothetical protein
MAIVMIKCPKKNITLQKIPIQKNNYGLCSLSYYAINSKWPMNFISCNEHKDENSVYKFGAQFNVLKILEK